MIILIPAIDCTADSDRLAGHFTDGRQLEYPHWYGRRNPAHIPILFYTGSSIYLYEKSLARCLHRVSDESERDDYAEFMDHASLVRRITIEDAINWFQCQPRRLPPMLRNLASAAGLTLPSLPTLDPLPSRGPAPAAPFAPSACPERAQRVEGPADPASPAVSADLNPNLLSTHRSLPSRDKTATGRPPLSSTQSLTRQSLLNAWRQSRQRGIAQRDFCREHGISRAHLNRCHDWADQRQRRQSRKSRS